MIGVDNMLVGCGKRDKGQAGSTVEELECIGYGRSKLVILPVLLPSSEISHPNDFIKLLSHHAQHPFIVLASPSPHMDRLLDEAWLESGSERCAATYTGGTYCVPGIAMLCRRNSNNPKLNDRMQLIKYVEDARVFDLVKCG
ncbi:hypothetical protein HAX54_042769 [Datura stramonium]|uniref:Uncharacterized protein n=1 Tax=Datura stramonium TaxID=4076 RepID=A0ABS8VZW6_DATST|nr:hypothetical protein [Datura stramonium]